MAMNMINGAIENATISQYASGVLNSSTDSTQGTATGVTRMMEAAAEKVGFMRSDFRRSWREVDTMCAFTFGVISIAPPMLLIGSARTRR